MSDDEQPTITTQREYPDGSKEKEKVQVLNMKDFFEFLHTESKNSKETSTSEWMEYDERVSRRSQSKKEFVERWDKKWEKEKNTFKTRRQGAYDEWCESNPKPSMPDTPPPLEETTGRVCICGKCK